MANVLVENQSLVDIADAIRSKNGTTDTYKPSEMAEAIEAISGGGITPTGTINITENGTVDVTQYANANVNVPTGGADLGTKSITANGTYNASSDNLDGYSSVSVNVPNTYGSGDEGKVVSNGALVAQTSDTVTQNGTVDTTLINSLLVNVSGGGGSGMVSGSFTQSGNALTKTIDIGDSSKTKFLLYAASSPYGNSVRCFSLAFFDFAENTSLAVLSNSSGSSATGVYNYSGIINGVTKSGSEISITSGGGSGSALNYFVNGITYNWFAW